MVDRQNVPIHVRWAAMLPTLRITVLDNPASFHPHCHPNLSIVFRFSFTLHRRKQKTYHSVISDIFDGKLVSSVQVKHFLFFQ